MRWSRYVFRRGTVPIWWGVELKSGGVGEANIVIPSATPYQGTRRWDCVDVHSAACFGHLSSGTQEQGLCNSKAFWPDLS